MKKLFALFIFILAALIQSGFSQDLYVDAAGSDDNTGRTPDQPLKTITAAISRILGNPPSTIHLAEGIYSPSTNGESYPLRFEQKSDISLSGAAEERTILDAEGTGPVLVLYSSNKFVVKNVTIQNGLAKQDAGGGIYCKESNMKLENVTVRRNTAYWGGGIACEGLTNTSMALSKVTIRENTAHTDGGGIYLDEMPIASFDPENRCNIFLNNAGRQGNDLFAEPHVPLVNVIVDTFTVMNPTGFNAYPSTSFAFDILHAKVEKASADLYVRADGDNANSGLSPSAPLRTLTFALAKIEADSLSPHTIYLDNGIYSFSTNQEQFPLNMISYVSLSGKSQDGVILDAERKSGILFLEEDRAIAVANMTITGGDFGYGGGIHCHYSGLSLSNVDIYDNRSFEGGGIDCYESNLSLEKVNIKYNRASYGGGIWLHDTPISFNPVNRCDIFLNQAILQGNELYTRDYDQPTRVVVDTFTVKDPTDDDAYPLHRFTFDILHAKIERVSRNLYVSPDGNDANSGVSPSEPLRSISSAIKRISADRLHPRMIYLADGVYSPSTNGERFPISMLSYVSLFGESKDGVILNAEGTGSVMVFDNDQNNSVENMTITGGVSYYGGGIYCEGSTPSFNNVNVIGNTAEHSGGGMYCSGSSPVFTNVIIEKNYASQRGGGISVVYSSETLLFKNVIIRWNTAGQFAGGMECEYSNPILSNVTIAMNSGEAITCLRANPILVNVTISGNAGGISCSDYSEARLVNAILWNNSPWEISKSSDSNVLAFYCDIKGGWQGQGNIAADPLFADPERRDFRLSATSPCIDRGTAFFVWNGDTLVNMTPDQYHGSAPDMGAYEYEPSTAVDHSSRIPTMFALSQNFPNPFWSAATSPALSGGNPSTTIQYSLPKPAKVTLKVYDLLGQEIATLVDEHQLPGYHQAIWRASGVGSGVYFFKIAAGEYSAVKKCLVFK